MNDRNILYTCVDRIPQPCHLFSDESMQKDKHDSHIYLVKLDHPLLLVKLSLIIGSCPTNCPFKLDDFLSLLLITLSHDAYFVRLSEISLDQQEIWRLLTSWFC